MGQECASKRAKEQENERERERDKVVIKIPVADDWTDDQRRLREKGDDDVTVQAPF